MTLWIFDSSKPLIFPSFTILCWLFGCIFIFIFPSCWFIFFSKLFLISYICRYLLLLTCGLLFLWCLVKFLNHMWLSQYHVWRHVNFSCLNKLISDIFLGFSLFSRFFSFLLSALLGVCVIRLISHVHLNCVLVFVYYPFVRFQRIWTLLCSFEFLSLKWRFDFLVCFFTLLPV